MQISKTFGLAVYVSAFKNQKPLLEKLKNTETPVFTSLHLTEEVTDSYVRDVEEMCEWLHENGFWIMADVSPLTLERFQEESLSSLSRRLHLNNVRLDFGFDLDKLKREELAVSFTYNASTLLEQGVAQENCLYMHNFYPRPETGLDHTFFSSLNERIKEKSGQILAFISGDEEKRGPLFEGLPTLEEHRYLSPYAQFIDLLKRHSIDKAFLGDIKLSNFELNLILNYLEDKLIRLPVDLPEELTYLYHETFTVRVDSPQTLIRVQESRQYAQAGKSVEPVQMMKRTKGSVTMDNILYKRYSGEVQITKKDYPKDERVNVIGQLDEKYHLLIDNLTNGERFMFIPTQ
ncbi:MAG: MupG family TIM beta-alpha barrel fold protein [Alkalibacterium sp.]|uniref:MupG family TIM beta-alpha barrel fold protein n=1 Tax=Alkalibacterium sp. TaxID=1872447 RepID=UPI0026485158|nr:MupG family TIM beta-alpha barrel fold protein [Alkalibacterium sp.]MDN6293752.1 MupG family TIM beta-alpha barrel fold protein [Alkalibacterium sp.]MDN6294895.1 MupG family TIM beta-alpha barrel fold protein [Alkalibacterium sp.]